MRIRSLHALLKFSAPNSVPAPLLIFGLVIFAAFTTANADGPKPNFILINIDDADVDMFSDATLSERFPNLHQLASRGVKFSNAHATTPLCGPSRACLLRAQYAHRCGIRVNEPNVPKAFNFEGGMRTYFEKGYADDDLSTWMKDAGYHTMHVGKFLHHDTLFAIPPGWDDFYSSVGGKYYGTHRITNRNGVGPTAEVLPEGIYRTDAESNDANDLIMSREGATDGKPFFMFLNPFGPHRQQIDSGEMYNVKYASLWPDIDLPASPAYDEEDMRDRKGPGRHLSRLNENNHLYFTQHHRERMLAMKSVDDMVGDLVTTLTSNGMIDNTYIFVTSDNGFLMGHHRMSGKGFPANRATNVPMLVAGPGIDQGESDHLLAHIDIGPTIVQLAGGSTPNFVDGVSFARLIANPESEVGIRQHVLIENFEARSMYGTEHKSLATSLRFKNAIYNEWAAGGREYFDLSSDPEQLFNVYGDLSAADRRSYATIARTSKSWAPAQAGFQTPYEDLEDLAYPYELTGVAEASVATRRVALAFRDLSTGKFWDGEQWTTSFSQIDANIEHRNGMLTYWNQALAFKGNQRPAGLIKAWVWGQDWSSNYQPPDTVVFRLGEADTRVTLDLPLFQQRFSSNFTANGDAVFGTDRELESIDFRIRDAATGQYWNGDSFQARKILLPIETDRGRWAYESTIPAGTYRISISGLDSDNRVFDVTHRLFYVD